MNNVKITGNLGEALVLDYLVEANNYSEVKLSDNPNDMHKDISADGLKIEVKTRTVIRKYHAMPLEQSQWYKVDSCDILYFVTNPTDKQEKIHVYEVTDKNNYSTITGFGFNKNSPVRLYDLSRMKIVKSVANSELISLMYDTSISKYKQES
jgi:hypothetical protein